MPFSRANINNAEALNVFEHYNMTGIPTVETSGIGGMQTVAELEEIHQGNTVTEENIKNMHIGVDVSALKASKLYDNKNNIINTFQHERKHVEDIKTQKGSYSKRERNEREKRAINYQKRTSLPGKKQRPNSKKRLKNMKKELIKNKTAFLILCSLFLCLKSAGQVQLNINSISIDYDVCDTEQVYDMVLKIVFKSPRIKLDVTIENNSADTVKFNTKVILHIHSKEKISSLTTQD